MPGIQCSPRRISATQGIVRGAGGLTKVTGSRPVGGAGAMGVFGIPDRGWHRGHRCRGYYSRYGHFRCHVGQFLSRYPVLKIHQMIAMQVSRKATVMPMLKETLTSAIS